LTRQNFLRKIHLQHRYIGVPLKIGRDVRSLLQISQAPIEHLKIPDIAGIGAVTHVAAVYNRHWNIQFSQQNSHLSIN